MVGGTCTYSPSAGSGLFTGKRCSACAAKLSTLAATANAKLLMRRCLDVFIFALPCAVLAGAITTAIQREYLYHSSALRWRALSAAGHCYAYRTAKRATDRIYSLHAVQLSVEMQSSHLSYLGRGRSSKARYSAPSPLAWRAFHH